MIITHAMMTLNILTTKPSVGYELIDSGDGEKLERYGDIILTRPDPQALWRKNVDETVWKSAHAQFARDGKNTEWILKPGVKEKWDISFGDLRFTIRPSSFKHTGLFPEQLPNWDWTREVIKKAGRPVQVLNLFGYTGGASIAAAQAGAQVCHVDGSKVAIGWGKDNQALSGLQDKPIRWILDDAKSFVEREIRRGKKYDGIIMDPPAFGHGPKKELWKIENELLGFMELTRQVLTNTPLFYLVSGYASGYSAIAYHENVCEIMKDWNGTVESGELTIEESKSGRLLPCGIYSRWYSIL